MSLVASLVAQMVKKSACNAWDLGSVPGLGRFPWRGKWHPTPVLLPGESRGRRSLVGCSPLGCEESDMTKRLHFHFSLSCIGEGIGNPLQYSCLENPRDGGAWWAAVYGVVQSRTRLKQLSNVSLCSRMTTFILILWRSNSTLSFLSVSTTSMSLVVIQPTGFCFLLGTHYPILKSSYI